MNSGFIVETSLGYYITPLVNVLLGVVVFRDRLRAGQWVAGALAAAEAPLESLRFTAAWLRICCSWVADS